MYIQHIILFDILLCSVDCKQSQWRHFLNHKIVKYQNIRSQNYMWQCYIPILYHLNVLNYYYLETQSMMSTMMINIYCLILLMDMTRRTYLLYYVLRTMVY